MKRCAMVLFLLLLVGCSAPTQSPPGGATQAPKVSEEGAVRAAKSADPRAGVEGWATWQVRLNESMEIEVEGKTEKRSVWVVEASHTDGEKLVVYVDAASYPPKVLRIDRIPAPNKTYITREKAIETALDGPQDVVVKDATFIEKYQFSDPTQGRRELAVWVVNLISKIDSRPVAKVVVDAQTAKVLVITNPPSGK